MDERWTYDSNTDSMVPVRPERVHVIPLGEPGGAMHWAGTDCWCSPKDQEYKGFHICAHNALKGSNHANQWVHVGERLKGGRVTEH